MASIFSGVQQGPPIEVFALNKAYQDDPFPNKVNLGVGAYRDEDGKPWVLPVVREVEARMAQDPALLHEYLPVLGLEAFTSAAVAMLLGQDCPAIAENRAFGVQTLSGTGALRLGAELLHAHLHADTFYVSDPTWENHGLVFSKAGFSSARTYRYWDARARALDLAGLLEDLRAAPPRAVVVLHACAHNPTGVDPTREQWAQIADVMMERQLFPFFDSAYQGFASGDVEADAWPVRYFLERGFELLVAQSFAKNFGLYNERVGCLCVVLGGGGGGGAGAGAGVGGASVAAAVRSQLTWLVRGAYSNPPAHGARVVAAVLSSPHLLHQWHEHIRAMSSRIRRMREALRTELLRLEGEGGGGAGGAGGAGGWAHVVSQIGMFSYTGLSAAQAQHLVQRHHVYLLRSGRINVAGLTDANVRYVAQAIHDAVTAHPPAAHPADGAPAPAPPADK